MTDDTKIDEFVEELLLQAPALVTHEELANYKQRGKQLITDARLEEANLINEEYYYNTRIEMEIINRIDVQKRIKELQASKGASEVPQPSKQPVASKSLTASEFKLFELTLGGMMGWVEDVLNGKIVGTHVVGAPIYVNDCRFRIEIYVAEVSKKVSDLVALDLGAI